MWWRHFQATLFQHPKLWSNSKAGPISSTMKSQLLLCGMSIRFCCYPVSSLILSFFLFFFVGVNLFGVMQWGSHNWLCLFSSVKQSFCLWNVIVSLPLTMSHVDAHWFKWRSWSMQDNWSLLLVVQVIHASKSDSRLANNDLPPDIQKLRCRVHYDALRFAPQIDSFGQVCSP